MESNELSEEEKVRFLERAILLSHTDVNMPFGKPFGAVVVVDGTIVGEAFNTTLRVNDPTAHAEVNAVRAACIRLATCSLPPQSFLFSSTEPCPLCYSASFWAGIRQNYFCLGWQEVSEFGFADAKLRKKLGIESQHGEKIVLNNHDYALEAFRAFSRSHPDWNQ